MYSTRWSTDLQPDLLREICGHLPDAADFIRFHAVCRPWRASKSRSRGVPMSGLLPWLLAPNHDNKDKDSVKIRSVFSKTTYRAPRSTALPLFPHWSDLWKKPSGTDGTSLLFDDGGDSYMDTFNAALLRPGDPAWTLLQRHLHCEHVHLHVVYHGGKIHVTADAILWHVITPPNHDDDVADVLVPMTIAPNHRYSYHHGYALETRGELLWVSVHIDFGCPEDADGLTVSVYALQQEAPAEKYGWVSKDGRSLADRVLFLGWPYSFAMDVSPRLGGCAYFVYVNNKDDAALEKGRLGVFRYNFVEKRAELVEWLPKGWNNERCTWLDPEPAIAPIQEIKERAEATKLKQQSSGPRRMVQMLQAFFQGARLSP